LSIVPPANKNLARGKEVTLSSERRSTLGAAKTVDGKLVNSGFSATKPSNSDHWIKVNLIKIHKVDRIEFYNLVNGGES